MSRPPNDYQRSFRRSVYCILGLPFDALTLEGATERLWDDIGARRRCLMATPNINFIVTARRDCAFRDSVLASDLSVADGKPVIWIARLLGLPFEERVAGASLFDVIAARQSGDTAGCYFLGGEDDAAELACTRLEETSPALRCAGSLNPGHGSVEKLSGESVIERINAARPDFLVVSLGAAKGQAWITANAPRLNATVISHLGAVVNFYAGNVKRAPAWMQRRGLEWLYRIRQEPGLARRYLHDAICLSWLLLTRVLPYALFLLAARRRHRTPGIIEQHANQESAIRATLSGCFGEKEMRTVREAFAEMAASARHLELDMAAVEDISPAFTGSLLVLRKHCDAQGVGLRLDAVPRRIGRILRWQGAEFLRDG